MFESAVKACPHHRLRLRPEA